MSDHVQERGDGRDRLAIGEHGPQPVADAIVIHEIDGCRASDRGLEDGHPTRAGSS